MQKNSPLMVLYRIKNDDENIYPNAFFTNIEQYPPRVSQIKKKFPWGQMIKHNSIEIINLPKQQIKNEEWLMRFGLIMNGSLNCDIWLDLKDNENVPMISDNQIFVQLQQK